MTQKHWKAIEERFREKKFTHWSSKASAFVEIPLSAKEQILAHFKKEFEATETPGGECYVASCPGRDNCEEMGHTSLEEKLKSKPESSWKEDIENPYDIYASKLFNEYEKNYSELSKKAITTGFNVPKNPISKVVSEAEKRGFNLALEEAEKVVGGHKLPYNAEDGIIEALRALKK